MKGIPCAGIYFALERCQINILIALRRRLLFVIRACALVNRLINERQTLLLIILLLTDDCIQHTFLLMPLKIVNTHIFTLPLQILIPHGLMLLHVLTTSCLQGIFIPDNE